MNSDLNKKYKRPKHNTLSTTNPGTSRDRGRISGDVKHEPQPLCPLLAKDSEWVDILQTTAADTSKSATNISDEEEVLQLVECEDGPQTEPLAIMFPGLLDKDPQTLQGVLNRAMSTTEVTRHLVDLGQKANFTFMKKANRLIPPEKEWMASLVETNHSYSSLHSGLPSNGISSEYEADSEEPEAFDNSKTMKKKKRIGGINQSPSEHS